MVVRLTEHTCKHCGLQMVACLIMRQEEQAITQKRELFSEIAKSKTLEVQLRLDW